MYLPLLLFFNSLYRFGLLSNDISFQPEGLPLVFLLEEVLEINSISFCSPGNILISPSFPKNRILDWQSFFFFFSSTSKISSHCLLASMVSGKSTVNLIVEFLVTSPALLTSLSLVFNSLTVTYLGMHLFTFILLGIHGAPCMYKSMFFNKFGVF